MHYNKTSNHMKHHTAYERPRVAADLARMIIHQSKNDIVNDLADAIVHLTSDHTEKFRREWPKIERMIERVKILENFAGHKPLTFKCPVCNGAKRVKNSDRTTLEDCPNCCVVNKEKE